MSGSKFGRALRVSIALGVVPLLAWSVETVPNEYDARLFRVSAEETDPCGKALDLVRALKAAHNGALPRGGVIVEFQDGIYPVLESWRLTSADSGSPECPIVYRAQHPGGVVFTGEVSLDWRSLPEAGNLPVSAMLIPDSARARLVTAKIPDGWETPSFFGASRYIQDELLDLSEYQYPWALYENGRRLDVARWPNDGFARVTDIEGPLQTNWIFVVGKSSTAFGGRDVAGNEPNYSVWCKEPDLFVHGEWRLAYTDVSDRPAAIDDGKGLITLPLRAVQAGIGMQMPWRAVNVISELDRPGEWALDFKARRIYAWPLTPEGRPVLAKTRTLLQLDGVTDVTFDGFDFRRVRGHAVVFRSCRNVILRTSDVQGASGWGVRIEGGVSCRVEGCDLHDLGEGGVWLEGGNLDTLTHSGHVCDNCHVWDYAKTIWNYNPGVYLFGCGNEATHNLIHDAPHQACFFYGIENRYAWNVAHDICQFTDDAGAIYSYNTHNAWSHRGNVIEYNVFHHIKPVEPEFCQLVGIYLDSFTSGTLVRGNLVSDVATGIFSSGGQNNIIERNLVFGTRSDPINRWNLGLREGKTPFWHYIWGRTNDCTRASYLMEPLLSKRSLYQMSMWTNRFPKMLQPLTYENVAWAHSSHFCRIADNVTAGCPPIVVRDAEVTKETTDVSGNMVIAGNPGFVDHVGMNWELRMDSPARKIFAAGTRFAEMGLYESPLRRSKAMKFGPDVSRPDPFNPWASQSLTNGFDYAKTFRAHCWLKGRPADCRAAGVPNAVLPPPEEMTFLGGVPLLESCAGLDSFTVEEGSDALRQDWKNGYPRFRKEPLAQAFRVCAATRRELEDGLAKALSSYREGKTDFVLIELSDGAIPSDVSAWLDRYDY